MRLSTILIVSGLLLIVIPIPVLPPFAGAIIGALALFAGLGLRLFGV